MKAYVEDLKSIPREDRTTSYDIIWGEKVAWMNTNDYVDAKRVAPLLGEPFNQSEDSHGVCEIVWRIPLSERKTLTKIGLNGNAQRRTKTTIKNTAEIM